MRIWTRLLLTVVLVSAVFADTPPQLKADAHWFANTGGTSATHVQNFITDMIVNYNPDPQFPRPMVLTASAWDEGGNAFGAYYNGASIGKAEWWQNIIYSDTATNGKMKCWIVNYFAQASYYRRTFVGHHGPVPTGINAPYVTCNDGAKITTPVVDPSALAFDMSGNLLIGDNGPDQNVKIFSPSHKFMRMFGDSGGVFAQSKNNTAVVPGTVGDRRFWGIYGLGVDSLNNIYVGTSGIPQQVMGGTDIRAFSGKDSSLLWKVQGLSFVNVADADPDSDGTVLSFNAKRFSVDYSKAPGTSWKLKSVTLDPFKYPFDPRITNAWESVWERKVQGTRYLYLGNMYGGAIAVVRFVPGSEIGIPTAYFCTYSDVQETPWVAKDSLPVWERNETNKRMRWYWIDRNGDGVPQKSEFVVYDNWNTYAQGLDIDALGNIWLSSSNQISSYFRSGGVTRFTFGTAKNGVPEFNVDSIKRFSVPYDHHNSASLRLKYIAGKDIMYMSTPANSWQSDSVYRYDNFSDTTKRKLVSATALGFDNKGVSEIHLDQGTDSMTLPYSFTADEDYIYVAYLDRGRYSRVRGEFTIYDAHTGKTVGYVIPDSTLLKDFGTTDLVNGINVTTQKDGHKLIMVEADGTGKSVVFRWMPPVKDTVVVPVQKKPVQAPQNLTGTPGDKSARLTWNRVSNALSYNVYRTSMFGDSLLASIPDTTYTVNGLVNGITYLFKLTAFSKDTVSPESNTVPITPKQPVPVAVTVSCVSTTKIVLAWGSVPAATTYRVIQSKDGVNKQLISTAKLTYSASLVSGSTYVFTIVPVNASGAGLASNQIKVVAP